jgi:hypothetical protein
MKYKRDDEFMQAKALQPPSSVTWTEVDPDPGVCVFKQARDESN